MKFTEKLLPSVFLLLLLPFIASLVHAERVYLDITASDVRKIIVAVPDFTGSVPAGEASGQGRKIAQLLSRGLEFHGFITVLDQKRYGGSQDADWRAFDVDYVVMGRFDAAGSAMKVEGRLLDVAEDRMLAGRSYKGTATQQDGMVLRLCDALIEEFTGEPGISRTSLAYVSDATGRKEVYIGDVLGRTQRQVTRHRHLCVSPRFSPDGFLAYSTYHRGNQDLYITDLKQSKVTRALSRRKGMNLGPAFSSDAKTMVVTLSKDGSPDLYLMDRKGKVLKRLTDKTGINVSPSFSPDGKSLAFVSDRSGRPQIYIMEVKTGKVRRLTFQGNENSEPAWSPKGDQIAYTGLTEGHYQVYTIDAAGGFPKQVTSGWGDYESPTWSPDGKQIAFARRRNAKSEICTVLKSGKELRVLFKLKGNQSYPQWSSRPE